MFTKTIQITAVTINVLVDKVAHKLLLKIKNHLDALNTNETEVYLTRVETAKFLKIDLSTLWHWTKKGKIISYGIGNKRYYNKQEIIETLKKNQL